MEKQIYTPGPTEVHPEILRAMSIQPTNADLDPDFYETFRDLCQQLSDFMKISGPSLIMVGEAILGLEAAMATYVQEGDKVVSVANGVFGHGFTGFAEMYNAETATVSTTYNNTNFDFNTLANELEDAAICTMVHCETPSGLLNPVEKVGELCQETDTLFVVDAVSSVFGTEVFGDDWNIDILLGGSQKALSLPTGLTLISLSKKANQLLNKVEPSASGFYANLTQWVNFLDGEDWLPYTHSQSLIYTLERGFEMIAEEGLDNVIDRHKKISKAVRNTITSAELELFPTSDEICSPTVTAYQVPEEIEDAAFRGSLWENYGLMIAGSLGKLKGDVQRLGHMGYQANIKPTVSALATLEKAFREENIDVSLEGWGEHFLSQL